MNVLGNLISSGGAAALLSAAAALTLSRLENGRAHRALDAVSHIAWGGAPPREPGRHGENFIVGAALHTGACFFWASVFEGVFGRWSRQRGRNALLAGAATALGACVTDYQLVARRFRPGFEVHLSRPALFGIYAALAAGFALGARMSAPRGRRAEFRARKAGRRKDERSTSPADAISQP